MNDETRTCCPTAGDCRNGRLYLYSLASLGTFLIVGWLVWVMIHYTRPAPLAEDRAALRRKNLAELRAANAEALNHYGWIDQARGIVRLPVEEAMRLTVQEWQNPAAARSNLIARAAMAAAPAPKAPEKPSQFE